MLLPCAGGVCTCVHGRGVHTGGCTHERASDSAVQVDAFPVHTTDTIAEYLRSQHKPLGAQWCLPACAPRCVLIVAREWRVSTCLRDV